MKFKPAFLFLLLIFLYSCEFKKEKTAEKPIPTEGMIDDTLDQFQKKYLKDKIDSVFSKYDFNASVAVFQDNILLYRKDQGFENFKKEKPLDQNSVFAIASISKQFTAVLILLLEENGKLSTEDHASKYLEEFSPKKYEDIRIKHLLAHTSGISDKGNSLLSAAGTEFHYSNKGFYYLGKIILKVSGRSYRENALELFQKTGMKNSSTADAFQEDHFASAYTGNSEKYSEVQNMPERLAEKQISVPAGGILTTVNDLHLWNNSLFQGKILRSESLHKMLERESDREHPVFGEMGYGFGMMMTNKNLTSYYHSGYVKGAPSLNIYYPDTKISVIILSNFANESLGKNAVFNPHSELKNITDRLQKKVLKTKK